MAKSTKRVPKEVTPITINGEEMFLKYNMYAMKMLRLKGIDLSNISEDNPLDFTDILTLLHCGLLTYDNTMTEDELGMIVDIDDLDYVMSKIEEAMKSAATEKN